MLAKSQAGEGGRPHGGVDGRARSGLVLREPKTHYRGKPLKSEAPEARTEAGVRPHNEVLFLLNLLGYEILHLEQATRRGWSLRRFRERVLPSATSGEAIDFRHQSRGDSTLARVSWAPG